MTLKKTMFSDEVLETVSHKLLNKFIMFQEEASCSSKDYKLLKSLFVQAFLEGALKRGEMLLEEIKKG